MEIMPKTFLTDSERIQTLTLVRKFVKISPQTVSRLGFRKIRNYITEAVKNKNVQRDVFGFNPIVTALETAIILGDEMRLDGTTMTGCLLAPFFEAGETASEDVEKEFGSDISSIAAGLKRVKGLYEKTPAVETENFRNLLVSFAEDMRVVLIMTADRLAAMRRIRDVEDKEARNRVAREAEFLYAPIAHKLGLYKIKSELEDLAVKYLEHDAYYLIREKLNATKSARDAYIADFISPINEKLEQAGLKFHIKGRTKSIHSIW